MDGVRWRRSLRRFRAPEVSRAWFTLRPDALCVLRRIQPYSRQDHELSSNAPRALRAGVRKKYSSGFQMFIQGVEIIRSQFNMNPFSLLWRHADRSQRICAIVREQSNRAASRTSHADHCKLRGLVDLYAETEFAPIEFYRALHVRDAQREPLQSAWHLPPCPYAGTVRMRNQFDVLYARNSKSKHLARRGAYHVSCGELQRTVCLIESLGFLASKHASRLPPISPHAWPSSCPGCRESDNLISKPSEASDVLARKFDVGQSVYLRPNLSRRNAAFGVYEIRATLPAEDGQFRYRIKSQLELHERVVKESELSKA
jgi:hypothetical protein